MRRLVALVALVALTAGCSTTAQDLPLPGSGVSGQTYRVVAMFDDALNLADGAPVKLHGVTIGRVREVSPENFTAKVTLELRESTPVHDGATARLRATTPLGELFVQIDDAESGNRLRDGATLGVDSTSAAPTIEDTMTSASLLLNGGGLGQLETIVREANLVLDGNEGTARDLLGRMARTAEAFNESNEDIDATLEALADLSTTLNRRSDTISAALEDVAPAARVLRKNTDELVDLLQSIERFGDVTTGVIEATRDDLLQTVRKFGPVFDELNSLGDELGPGIDTLVSFAGLIDRGVPTDYLNTHLHFQLDGSLAGLLALPLSTPAVTTPDPDGTGGLSGTPLVPPDLLAPQPSTEKPGLLGGLLGLFGGDR
jgi:phospholipid/cholesterol/gamma-HCH transport system substrate-binding protein